MPIKYIGGNPEPVRVAGWIHGVAFVVYVVLMWVALRDRGWSRGEWGRTLAAAFVPFGTFVNDPFLKAKMAQRRR
jgi:integral membrane protein